MTRKLNKNNLSERLKPKIINNNNFPSDREIEEITKKVSAPNYPYANYILPDNANPTERINVIFVKIFLTIKGRITFPKPN